MKQKKISQSFKLRIKLSKKNICRQSATNSKRTYENETKDKKENIRKI